MFQMKRVINETEDICTTKLFFDSRQKSVQKEKIQILSFIKLQSLYCCFYIALVKIRKIS